MKYFKRFSVIFFAIVILFSLFPFQAFAVDPVSAGVMANAFAQAIASYGAANGVAMTFDVSSTDGIGESVHDLWKRFREGQQTADDYATIAQAIFPELYYKTSTAIASAADAVAVGVHISSEYAEELDNFYNWLLSGPAEMVQVDNQYYQFSQAQIGPEASDILVYGSDSAVSIVKVSALANTYAAVTSGTLLCVEDLTTRYNSWYSSCVSASSDPVYCYAYINSNNVSFYFFSESPFDFSTANTRSTNQTNTYNYNTHSAVLDNNLGLYIFSGLSFAPIPTGNDRSFVVPVIYPSLADAKAASTNFLSGNIDSVGVQAYDTSGIADFPDTADPNYDALNRAKDIPLNIPWDDAIYGDGTGTLTDAQSAAIAGDLTQALETDRTVELVEEQDIPIQPDYSDVLLPLIPINVPSFNFSLSGIWHYVRSWVTSLGAWLSMMFSVWGILPYAIVVPVYACLVIVIVLGLYKRFFM